MQRTAHKAFVEKEEKLRKTVLQIVEEELVKDFTRLLEEETFADVTFQVANENLSAHVSVLSVRAPTFYQQFISRFMSSSSSPISINIQEIEAKQFKLFLRSVYTANIVNDQNENLTSNATETESSNCKEDCRQNGAASISTTSDTCTKQQRQDLIHVKACCKIGEDLLLLIDDEKTADVTFVLEECKMVKAHRAILQARSSYFAAMLAGGWSEANCREIHLKGVPYRGFMTILHYLYGGITNVPVDLAHVYNVLELADMYGLQELKEVVTACLKIEKCHLFHKPCKTCVGSTSECLEISERFHLTAFKKECIRWIAKYFERVCCTREFASASKEVQDQVLEELQTGIARNTVMSLLERCDRLSYLTPTVRWAEPVHSLVIKFQAACLAFAAQHLSGVLQDSRFIDMIKGVGWFISIIEKIFEAVADGLTVDNCCVQLRAATRLGCKLSDEDEKYPEEIKDLQKKLYCQCSDFIRSNLHRVVATGGWNTLDNETRSSFTSDAVLIDVIDGKALSRPSFPARAKAPLKRPTSSFKPPSTRPISSATWRSSGAVPKPSQRSGSAVHVKNSKRANTTQGESNKLSTNRRETSAAAARGKNAAVPKTPSRNNATTRKDVCSYIKEGNKLQGSKSLTVATLSDRKSGTSDNASQLVQKRSVPVRNRNNRTELTHEQRSEGAVVGDASKSSIVINGKTAALPKVTKNSRASGAVPKSLQNSKLCSKDTNQSVAIQGVSTVPRQGLDSASVDVKTKLIGAVSQCDDVSEVSSLDGNHANPEIKKPLCHEEHHVVTSFRDGADTNDSFEETTWIETQDSITTQRDTATVKIGTSELPTTSAEMTQLLSHMSPSSAHDTSLVLGDHQSRNSSVVFSQEKEQGPNHVVIEKLTSDVPPEKVKATTPIDSVELQSHGEGTIEDLAWSNTSFVTNNIVNKTASQYLCANISGQQLTDKSSKDAPVSVTGERSQLINVSHRMLSGEGRSVPKDFGDSIDANTDDRFYTCGGKDSTNTYVEELSCTCIGGDNAEVYVEGQPCTCMGGERRPRICRMDNGTEAKVEGNSCVFRRGNSAEEIVEDSSSTYGKMDSAEVNVKETDTENIVSQSDKN